MCADLAERAAGGGGQRRQALYYVSSGTTARQQCCYEYPSTGHNGQRGPRERRHAGFGVSDYREDEDEHLSASMSMSSIDGRLRYPSGGARPADHAQHTASTCSFPGPRFCRTNTHCSGHCLSHGGAAG